MIVETCIRCGWPIFDCACRGKKRCIDFAEIKLA